MDSKPSERKANKRPLESPETPAISRPKKRLTGKECVEIDDDGAVKKRYNFRVLLPNGASLGLEIRRAESEITMEDFVDAVRGEYSQLLRKTESRKPRRKINWKSQELYAVDAFENKMTKNISLKTFKPNECHLLRLHDGSGEAETYENMWDLTPDTDLLKELPEDYTFETALADLIDNSLQAIWSNGQKERKLISLEVHKDRISIFDTGPGMDGSEENSVVKWGKMGASHNRSSRRKAVGIKPPYLMPCFGMFGYGGFIASMHLGRRAAVSSKTKNSQKVYMLHLKREALLSSSGSEKTWTTNGGLRNPEKDEIQKSPHGSFTKVEIFEPKMKSPDTLHLQCILKDIYFPYIQSDELSKTGKTIRPIVFQVNGTDLAEIEGGEVAITNLHSCNGPDFAIQLRFSFSQEAAALCSPGSRANAEANARLKFVYFPVVKGKESIDSILEKLKEDGCVTKENYETFSRVSIRRLGRLLPDARWAGLPFMKPPRKVDRNQSHKLKKCCPRVKCFIDTDAGFKPTPSKTDLAHTNPFIINLKNFGSKSIEKDGAEVQAEIHKDGKEVSLAQLEKQYQEWIFKMHDRYDEEIDSGVDQPVVILIPNPSNKKGLAISSDGVRIHKVIKRKGKFWRSGQKIKILKGACAGYHNGNVYATLEYILLEGFQGDAGGEARLICRPMNVPDEKGCLLEESGENPNIDIRQSICLPVSVIDSGKCEAIEIAEWNCQLEKRRPKIPSSIDVLSSTQCHKLDVHEALPCEATVDAGHDPPEEIVAVVRPSSFVSASSSKDLDQKYILKEKFEMVLKIQWAQDENLRGVNSITSACITSSSRKGFDGVYIYSLRHKFPKLFQKAGLYIFTFSLRDFGDIKCEKRVQVNPLPEVRSWGLLRDGHSALFSARAGSCLPPFAIACYDRYENRTAFSCLPKVKVTLKSNKDVLAHVDKMKLCLLSSKRAVKVMDMLIESKELDKIQPSYETTLLLICARDKSLSLAIPCKVLPGTLHRVAMEPPNLEAQLLPGHVVEDLVLEMFDAYDNHVEEGIEILLNLDGFHLRDRRGCTRKVDSRGCVDLSGVLEVTKGYAEDVSLSVSSGGRVFSQGKFQTVKRELRASTEIPKFFAAGSVLENLIFEIVKPDGDLDESIHDDDKSGASHTLKITSESLDIDDSLRYSFCHGRCIVRALTLPLNEGNHSFVAAHTRYPELHTCIEVNVVQQHPAVEIGSSQAAFSNGNIPLLEHRSAHKVPKAEYNCVDQHSPDGKLMVLHDSYTSSASFGFNDTQCRSSESSAPKVVDVLITSLITDLKGLEDDVVSYGLRIGEQEKKLEMLNSQQISLEQQISQMQDDIDNCGSTPEKEEVIERIECKTDSAAAVVCKLLRTIPLQEQRNGFPGNILGVVATLGAVKTYDLGRMLAEYLGEDRMLAVVCKSYADADSLEKYEPNGSINQARAFYELANVLGKSINGRFHVICLEDIRPFMGNFTDDTQRNLVLPYPTLPSGETPPGFLGYAVNMIHLDIEHLHTRTNEGHGLRETLFYRLFGELQVYETRDCMKMANSSLKLSAVSLDGGIIRGNGLLSLGYREPDIWFPVITPRIESKLIEETKMKLRATLCEIVEETKSYEKDKKIFVKKRDKYNKFLYEKEPLLKKLSQA